MTQNALSYLSLQETKRSNKAREAETQRNNLATERETQRSNIAREIENNRSNLAKEGLTLQSNLYTNAHWVRQDQETTRHNVATELENNRHNIITEMTANTNAVSNAVSGANQAVGNVISLFNAQTNRMNAETNRQNMWNQYELGKESNALTNAANAVREKSVDAQIARWKQQTANETLELFSNVKFNDARISNLQAQTAGQEISNKWANTTNFINNAGNLINQGSTVVKTQLEVGKQLLGGIK